jgi:tripartite-type tricarboxylate transporter receptor subunit TctC
MMNHIKSLATVILVALAMLACRTAECFAQNDYPNRAIKIIVPAPPGPVLDVLPRIVGEKLAARWSQPVIIENRPGFAQNLGAEAVTKGIHPA